MFTRKKKRIDTIPISEVKYVPGAKMYVGGEEVFMILLALIFARAVIDKLPQKKVTPHLSVLYKCWGDLIQKNSSWMEDMAGVNEL